MHDALLNAIIDEQHINLIRKIIRKLSIEVAITTLATFVATTLTQVGR